MANRWRNNGNSERLYFGGAPKSLQMVIEAVKFKTLAPWMKSCDKLSMLKSKAITLPIKIHIVKAMVFLIVMYGCESWTVKKTECLGIDAFELWRWRPMRVPWTARRSNQSMLKEIVLGIHWKDWCWSWSSNTLATWCKELTHWKRPWCWARLKAGGEGDNKGWDGWMASPTWWTWVWAHSRSEAWHAEVHGVSKSQTRLSNRTELRPNPLA